MYSCNDLLQPHVTNPSVFTNTHAHTPKHPPLCQAAAACQLIEELTEFLGADSLDGFVLSYGSIVSLAPGITPTLLGGLLAARVAAGTEFSKADAKEVRR